MLQAVWLLLSLLDFKGIRPALLPIFFLPLPFPAAALHSLENVAGLSRPSASSLAVVEMTTLLGPVTACPTGLATAPGFHDASLFR